MRELTHSLTHSLARPSAQSLTETLTSKSQNGDEKALLDPPGSVFITILRFERERLSEKTHPLTHSLTHSLARPSAHSLTEALTSKAHNGNEKALLDP